MLVESLSGKAGLGAISELNAYENLGSMGTAMKNRKNQSSVFLANLSMIGWLVTLIGCGRVGQVQVAVNPADQPATQVQGPSQVCELLLDAVARGDRESVIKQLATKRIASDVQSITQGKKGFEKFASSSGALAAASFITSIELLEKNSRRITRETISNGEATVTVTGLNRDNKELSKEVRFVHEDGAWKLVPSRF